MKKRNISKTGIVILITTVLLSSTSAVSLSNVEFDDKDTRTEIPPDWVDIGPGEIRANCGSEEGIGLWMDFGPGIPFMIPIGSYIIIRARFHILPFGKIYYDSCLTPEIEVYANGNPYSTFWLTGFSGLWRIMSLRSPDMGADNLVVRGYANHVYVPPS